MWTRATDTGSSSRSRDRSSISRRCISATGSATSQGSFVEKLARLTDAARSAVPAILDAFTCGRGTPAPSAEFVVGLVMGPPAPSTLGLTTCGWPRQEQNRKARRSAAIIEVLSPDLDAAPDSFRQRRAQRLEGAEIGICFHFDQLEAVDESSNQDVAVLGGGHAARSHQQFNTRTAAVSWCLMIPPAPAVRTQLGGC